MIPGNVSTGVEVSFTFSASGHGRGHVNIPATALVFPVLKCCRSRHCQSGSAIAQKTPEISETRDIRDRKSLETSVCFLWLSDCKSASESLRWFESISTDHFIFNDLGSRKAPFLLGGLGGLLMVIPQNQPALLWVSTAIESNDPLEIYEDLHLAKSEGVAFKEVDAPSTRVAPIPADRR